MACRLLYDVICGKEPTILMHLFTEPEKDGLEVAGIEVIEKRGLIFLNGVVELGSVDAADRISGEVAEIASAPVHILQNTVGIGGRGDAEKFLHFVVPGSGELVDSEFVVDEGELEFVTEDDVEAIGEFVCFDADEGGFDQVDVVVPGVEAGVFEGGGGCSLEDGVEVGPEVVVSADDVFPEAGLGFVEAQAWGVGDDGVLVFAAGEAEFVEGVSGFVHGGEEGEGGAVAFVVGGDADVGVGEGGGEGVGGDVESGFVWWEVHVFKEVGAEGLLLFEGEGAGEGFLVLVGGGVFDGVEDGGEVGAEGVEFAV